MEVQVKFVGIPDLTRAVGGKRAAVRIEGATFGDLLRHLERAYGAPVRKALLTERGVVDDTIQVLRNGTHWVGRDALDTPLEEGDEITFLLMMAGG